MHVVREPTSDICGNNAIATGKAKAKERVVAMALQGRWNRGFLFKNLVLNKT